VRRLVAVALVLVSCEATSIRSQTLTLAFTPGSQYRYGIHETSHRVANGLTAPPSTIEMTGVETATVNSVDPAGNANLTLAVSEVTLRLTVNGRVSISTTTVQPKVVVVGSDGRLHLINGLDVGAEVLNGIYGGAVFISALLPSKSVAPGDKWSTQFSEPSINGGTGAVQVTTHSTYLRDEVVQGTETAVVETATTEAINLGYGPSGSTKVPPVTIRGYRSMDVTTWIDPGNHRIVKSQIKSSEAIAVTQSGSASYSYKDVGAVDLTAD